jgi:transcriptional regulator with XRE-family HTH domain
MGVSINVNVLKNEREAKGWSQRKLAEEVGCNPRNIERAESRGRTSLTTLLEIAEALGKDPQYFRLVRDRIQSCKWARSDDHSADYPSDSGEELSGSDLPLRRWLYPELERDNRPELQYDNLYRFRQFCIPYIKLHGSRDTGVNEYSEDRVKVDFEHNSAYEFPRALQQMPCPAISHDGDKVRLARYAIRQSGDGTNPTIMQAWFSQSRVKYSESCKVARHIDKRLPHDRCMSYRNQFAPKDSMGKNNLPCDLPNVCGVGFFLIAQGKSKGSRQIIITHQAPTQAFSAGLWSYSASGSMDWPETGVPNPFADVERETWQEIHHRISRRDVRLIGLGMDAKELYVQFSFVEETAQPAEHIIEEANDAEHEFEWDDIKGIDFTPDAVVRVLLEGDWEPAAAAALITIASKEFGKHDIADFISARYAQRVSS